MNRVSIKIVMLSAIALVLLGATRSAGFGSFMPTRSPTPGFSRAIEIELLSTHDREPFELESIFSLRAREGFLISTHHSRFWQPGDFWDAGSLDVHIIFDGGEPQTPFVFWRSSVVRDVQNELGEPVGRFLDSAMYISIDTSGLALGTHTLSLVVETPRDARFSQTWQFVIRERETPRLTVPVELAPTAEYLAQYPEATPAFVQQLSTEAAMLDQFSPIGASEGLCVMLDDRMFVSSDALENPFRSSAWQDVQVTVDGIALPEDRYGFGSDHPSLLFVCIKTDPYEVGMHLAQISLFVDGVEYSHIWAFSIEP